MSEDIQRLRRSLRFWSDFVTISNLRLQGYSYGRILRMGLELARIRFEAQYVLLLSLWVAFAAWWWLK